MSRWKVRTTPPRTCTWPFVEKEKASSKSSFLGSTSVFRGVCKIVNDIHSHLLPHESCGHVATWPCANVLTSHRKVSKMRLHDTSTSSKGMLGTHAILPYPVTCDDRRRFMIAPFFVAQIRLWPNLHELLGVEELLRELVANVFFFCVNLSIMNIMDSPLKVGIVIVVEKCVEGRRTVCVPFGDTQAKDGRKPLAQHRELAGLDVCLM